MKIDCIPYQGLNPLVEDYTQHHHSIQQMFSYMPMDDDSFLLRGKKLKQRTDPCSRKQLVDVLRRYHQPELHTPAIERNLQRLEQPESMVVIGGQQAGLLTGPLYTIHKAITLIQLARREETRLRLPVIPVFWIAGEDHDRDEVDHVWVQNSKGVATRHRFPRGNGEKRSIANLMLQTEEVHAWLDELSQILPDREYKKKWLQKVKEWSAGPISWTRFFARILHAIFGKYGLILIDSADPGVRKLETPFFKQLIKKNEAINKHVIAAIHDLNKLGYAEPVDVLPNAANLFIEIKGERYLLVRDHEMWITKDGQERFSTEQLLTIAETEPERLSNNVITRPLMQEYLFPTLAFVGGPGEIAYWSLLKKAFAEVGLEMPIVFPRISITILDRLAEKRMKEFGLTWTDLLYHFDQKREDWLKQQVSLDVDAVFHHVQQQISEIYRSLISQLDREVGMNLREMGQKNEQYILQQVEYLKNFTRRTIERKHQIGLKHWDELAQASIPERKPQERVYNLIQLWNQVGLEWIDQLLETSLLSRVNHHYCIIL